MRVEISYLESDNPWVAHKTWRRIDDEQMCTSALQNQYALHEYGLDAATAGDYFRRWLWVEMQDEQNVVWRELSALTTAAEEGKEVEIRVPQGQTHGECIARALQWMLENTEETDLPARYGSNPSSLFPETEDGVFTCDDRDTGVDTRFIVEVTGKREKRRGIIYGKDKVLIPGYGVHELSKFKQVRWANKWQANDPHVQEELGCALDAAFREEMVQTPSGYEAELRARLDYPDKDFEDMDIEAHYAPGDAEQEVVRAIDQEGYGTAEDAYTDELAYQGNLRRGALYSDDENRPAYTHTGERSLNVIYRYNEVRPAYLHTGEHSLLKILTPEAYAQGKRFRYATQEETQEYMQTHRKPTIEKPANSSYKNRLPTHVREMCQKRGSKWG